MCRWLAIMVTAASVLWHAVVGCCAHHDHDQSYLAAAKAGTDAAAQAPAKPVERKGRGCCKHKAAATPPTVPATAGSHAATNAAPSSTKHPTGSRLPQSCGEEQCSFIASEIVHASDFVCDSSATFWITGEFADYGFTPAVQSHWRSDHNDRPPQLRSHLALNILLI